MRPPSGTSWVGVRSTTSPLSSGAPSTSTSDLKPATRLGGKLVTATTSLPTSSSGRYSAVICALDRRENVRRAGEVARLFYEGGAIVLCAFVSPFREDRDAVRSLFPEGSFLELFVDGFLVFSSILPDAGSGGAVACVLESGNAEYRLLRTHALEPLPRAVP